MDTLLPYYERELIFLRKLSQDFAKRYPKVAGRLLLSGETCEDPHIERLIESFAFLAGRIHKKLDDDLPEVTDALLQVVYPQYLRPFPSVSIVHFDCTDAAAQLTKAARIPRGTSLDTRPVRGVPCRFATVYDVDVWPVRIADVAYETQFDTNGLPSAWGRSVTSVIRIDLDIQQETAFFDALDIGTLRFFLNGEPAVVSLLREALFSRTAGLWISMPNSSAKLELPAGAIRPVGFAEHESLLEPDPRSHQAHQLLLEYFAFPDKFNFFDLDLRALKGCLPPGTRTIQIRIGLAAAPDHEVPGNLLDRIGAENFVLGCTPAINLFRRNAEPIRATGMASSYPVIVDSRRSHAYDVYEIKRVFSISKSDRAEDVREYRPFYSLRHGEPHDGPARYWHASYADDGTESAGAMELALVDTQMRAQQHNAGTLSIDITCTNRDLPSQLPFGLAEGDLFAEGGSLAKAIRFLRRPTASHRFPRGRGAQWRLVSHLALNHLSLSGQGVDAIREMLALYDISGSPSNSRQIGGIVAIEHGATMARMGGNPFPVFVRGVEVRVTVDETHYAGIGLFVFAQVLEHFFALYVHTNSFTQLVLISKHLGQELIRCKPRNGAMRLA